MEVVSFHFTGQDQSHFQMLKSRCLLVPGYFVSDEYDSCNECNVLCYSLLYRLQFSVGPAPNREFKVTRFKDFFTELIKLLSAMLKW